MRKGPCFWPWTDTHKANLGPRELKSTGREQLLQKWKVPKATLWSVLLVSTLFHTFSEFINEREMKQWLKKHILLHFSANLQ